MSYLKFIILLCIGLVFILSGCVENNVAPGGSNATVHLFDCNCFPAAFNNANVSLGKYPLLIPDWTGTVSLQIKSFPFSFVVYNDSTKYEHEYINVYDCVMRNEIYVAPLENLSADNCNWVHVNIIYPKGYELNDGYLHFISKDLFGPLISNYDLDSTGFTCIYVCIPANKTSITGKVLLLIYSESEEMYFQNFGMKDVTLSMDSDPQTIFTENDLNFFPSNNNIYLETILPVARDKQLDIQLEFDGYNSSSDFDLYGIGLYGDYGYVSAPASLPLNFQVKIISQIYMTDRAVQEKWVSCMPGSFIQINNSKQTRLFFPHDKEKNISGSTPFNFGSDTTGGIFYLRFFGKNTIQTFVTSKTGVTLGEIENKGFTFSPNTQYEWWVEQPVGFKSVDDYLSAPYLQNPNYTWKLCSEVRTFTTAP